MFSSNNSWDKVENKHKQNMFALNNGQSALYNAIKDETQGNTNPVKNTTTFGQYGANPENNSSFGSSSILNGINSFVNSGSSGSGTSGGSGAGGSVPWAAIGALAKSGYNSLTNQTDKDYSDTEESIVYPLQGASLGAQFGPWGAAGGALYGLGYSFKDDMGLKDSNFFTKMLYPIDLGGDYADWLSL